MRIALIKNGTVGNIAEFDNLSKAQIMAANMSLLAVSVADLPVAIGDIYSDGRFYRDGQEVTTPEDIIIQLQEQLSATVSDVAEILVDQEYRLILLELGVV